MSSRTTSLCVLASFAVLQIACTEQRYTDPLSPSDALKSLHVREGFRVELFAAEPYVADPVDMVFDEQGNCFVIEMPDYPFKPAPGKGLGRIKALFDADDDGLVDKSIVFEDSISEATSLLPWKGGLIVTTAPYILYLRDTTGDFQADTKEVLFSGFFENNSEAQITSLRLGVDNWVYASNNGQPGEVTFARDPTAPALTMRGADFRFRLDRGQFELEAGTAQFGHTMNDWGHRFLSQNTIHIRHVVVPWRYLHRHPHAASPASSLNISDHDLEMFQETPAPYWRAERTRRRQKEFDEQKLDRTEYAEDHFTGASGGMVYLGDAFPQEYYGNVFTGEVAGNLIHRDVLVPLKDSPTFVAKRPDDELSREFLSSSDPWFRPSTLTVGPDGCMYVIDFYRQHVETPLSVPEDLKQDMDFLNGSTLGRVYRVVPESSDSRKKEIPRLKEMESAGLVSLLSHPNGWWRSQAQRLLLERQDMSVVPSLTDQVATHPDARARLHALYGLEGLSALDATIVGKALSDTHSGVREHAVILAERYPDLLSRLVQMVQDTSVRVAFQVTLSLGQFSGEKVVSAMAAIVDRFGNNPWFQTAVLSSEAGSSLEMLKILDRRSFFEDPGIGKASFFEGFCHVIGSRNKRDEVKAALVFCSAITRKPEWQTAGLAGIVKGLSKVADADPQLKEALEGIKTDSNDEVNKAIRKLIDHYSSRPL